MTIVSECPCCGTNSFSPFLQCTDHTVSHETFQIVRCTHCGFLLTSPRPDEQHLANYYLSPQYISHNKQSHTLLDRVYKTARYFTLRWKRQILQDFTKTNTEPTLLDYGCGTGDFLHHCVSYGWTGYGIEPSHHARQQIPGPTAQRVYTDLQHSTIPKVHAITLWHVLEHVPDLHETLAALRDHLLPHGTLFIAVPNPESHNAIHYSQHWAAYDVPRHLWHFTRQTMAQILSKHQLTVTRILPMKLDAYYISLLSEQYQKRSPLSASFNALRQGITSNSKAARSGQYASLIYIARP